MTGSVNRQFSTRLVVKVILLMLGLALSNHMVLERAVYFVQSGLWFPMLVFGGIWFACLLGVLYSAFTPAKGWQLTWTIVIGISTLLGETLYRFSGDVLTIARLDEMLATTTIAAQNQAVNPDASFDGFLALLNVPLLIALLTTGLLLTGMLMSSSPMKRLQSAWLGLLPVLPLVLLTVLAAYVGGNRGRELLGMPSQFASAGVIAAYAMSPRPSTVKREPGIEPMRETAANHILLIIDESVSGDFIDLNRPRGTTPYLQANADDFINFGLALAAHNCSENSNAILRLGAAPDQLGNPSDRILNNPSIWQYAALAGFETSYINAQFAHETWQYHFNEDELALIDHVYSSPDGTPRQYRDLASLQLIEQALGSERPQFIVLVKNGTHTPYDSSHPEDAVYFEPAMSSGEKAGDRQKLVNSYRNAIRWNVDHFFSEFMAMPALNNFVLIYTSDHGQNLLDDGSPVTHCRRIAQTLSEAIVPLMVTTDIAELERRFQKAAVSNYNSASHFRVFPTLLDLFGFAPEDIRNTYYYSLFETVDEPLGFVSGPIMGRFGARPHWNPRKGMEDFKR